MPFTFSFKLTVPGLTNPFSSPSSTRSEPIDHDATQSSASRTNPVSESVPAYSRSPSRGHSSSQSSPAPLSRKRGWVPATTAGPSQATVMTASTTGFLDTPSKYREAAGNQIDGEGDEVMVELPPSKRRKGITGSVIDTAFSTAFSAALIGAAVGLTVYRLWRDRGREADQSEPSPPPPYQEEWIDARLPESSSQPQQNLPRPRVPKQKPNPLTSRRHRRPQQRGRNIRSSGGPSSSSAPPYEGIGEPQEDEAADKMEWIGDRLTRLIEEGKRALGKEVVVMSDAKEDEEDDGSGNWIEDEPTASPKRSRIDSPLRHRQSHSYDPPTRTPQHLNFGAPSNLSSGPSGFASGPSTPIHQPQFSPAFGTPTSYSGSTREPEREWESPYIRESMERARAAFRQRLSPGSNLGETSF